MIKQQIVKIIKGHCTVKVQGENYAPRDGLDEAADKIASLFSSPEASRMLAQPQNDAEAIAWMMPEHIEAYRKGERDGIAWANHTKTDAYTVPLYTAPPSPERMREALDLYRGMSDEPVCSGPNVANIIETICALSAGDNHASDGKKSEGLDCSSLPSGESDLSVTTGSSPSDPTPAQERREEIARIVRHFIGTEVQQKDYGFRYSNEAFDKMVDALALPPAPKGEPSREWKPIETAPKDGCYLLVGRFSGDLLVWVKHSRWLTVEDIAEQEGGEPENYDAAWVDGEDEDEPCYPTHWMPLPKSPALRREPEGER